MEQGSVSGVGRHEVEAFSLLQTQSELFQRMVKRKK
jgi:hypothetical protein